MKRKYALICALAFLAASCEPFLLSLFPGYLADLAATAEVGGYFKDAPVEHFDFCVLNDGTGDYCFLLAYHYNTDPKLVVFDQNLSFVQQVSNPRFGSRNLVDESGNFVIGETVLSGPLASPSPMPSPMPGTDGFGNVILEGDPSNAIVNSAGSTVEFNIRTTAWAELAVSTTRTVAIQPAPATGTFSMAYSRRLVNINTVAGQQNAAVMVLQSREQWPPQGYAVILLETGSQYADISNCQPLLTPQGDYHFAFPVGAIADEGQNAWAMADGIIIRSLDGTLKFISWNGSGKSKTRDNGAAGNVLMDFGFTDFYYVFDPATMRLYKAANWWQK